MTTQHIREIRFSLWKALASSKQKININAVFHINTNEIPGEISREKMISLHVKTNFHMWKDYRCYGYIINGAFRRKKLFTRNGLVIHW